MEEMKVSVIIPAYNTQEYIDDMLESVINQTYRNVEIIVINDGSTDDTLSHIKKYEAIDDRIYCIDIPNGGVSNARNKGIDMAKGEKIFFWDSDDVIEPETIEECIKFCFTKDVNAVLYGYSNRVNGQNGTQHKSYLRECYKSDEIVRDLLPNFIGHSFQDINLWIKGKRGLRTHKEHTALWRIMLDAKIIKDCKLYFDTELTLGEDTKFICEYFLNESAVGYLDKCFYHLTIRTTGANMTSNSNINLMRCNKIKLINARRELDAIGEKKGMNLHAYWEGTMVLSAIQLIVKAAKSIEGGVYRGYPLLAQRRRKGCIVRL